MNSEKFSFLWQAPTLVVGEDLSLYDKLRDNLLAEIKPTTLSEHMLSQDIVAAEWELLRLHGFRAGMLNVHILALLQSSARLKSKRTHNHDPFVVILKLIRRVQSADQDARAELIKLLGKHQLSVEDVAASAYEGNIGAQLQTEQLIHAALRRRETAYTDLERRRTYFAQLPAEDKPKLLAVDSPGTMTSAPAVVDAGIAPAAAGAGEGAGLVPEISTEEREAEAT